MKGVILAGGKGTRLSPLTDYINKHLLPVGRYPMIYYPIEKLKQAGITDILLVISDQSAGLYTKLLGSGRSRGVKITYKIQEEAGGIAEALSAAEQFVPSGESLVVMLGDNLFEDPLTPYVEAFREQAEGARVLLKQVEDPRRYGVPILDQNKIVRIIEKPEEPPSSYCVTGIYMYSSDVFDIIKGIEPSERGELEITDVNNKYASEGRLAYDILPGWWLDAGTFESLQAAGNRLLQKGETD
jgi:glucose-1-phosphate thymidylyltransferase